MGQLLDRYTYLVKKQTKALVILTDAISKAEDQFDGCANFIEDEDTQDYEDFFHPKTLDEAKENLEIMRQLGIAAIKATSTLED